MLLKTSFGSTHQRYFPVAFSATLVISYCLLFLARPPVGFPETVRKAWLAPRQSVENLVEHGLHATGFEKPTVELSFTIYLVLVTGVVPLLACAAVGRRPRDMGTRLPNRLGWRLGVLGIFLSFPFLLWMTQSKTIADPYLEQWRRLGPFGFCTYYFAIMLMEHWFQQGVVLGWCRRGLRWPESAPVTDEIGARPIRLLRRLGLAQPTGGAQGFNAIMRWLGVPEGCVPAMIISGLLFGAIHVGKDWRELLLSFPGGLAQSYLAYRTDSWLTPFFQHLATAALAFLMMLATH